MSKALETLCRNLDELLRERGWKRKDLAEGMGMLPSQLSGYLTGNHSPTLDVLSRMGEALSVSVGRLFAEPNQRDHSIDECLRRVADCVQAAKKFAQPVKKT